MYCQPQPSPVYIIERYFKLINNENIDLEDLQKRYEEAKKELNLDSLKNLIPKIDTIIINGELNTVIRDPLKKYSLEITHPNYKSQVITDSFSLCSMNTHTIIRLEKL